METRSHSRVNPGCTCDLRGAKIRSITHETTPRGSLSEIKPIRTDTTQDLSPKAEKVQGSEGQGCWGYAGDGRRASYGT